MDYIAALNPMTGDIIEYNDSLYMYIRSNEFNFHRYTLLMLDDFIILDVMGNLVTAKMICRFSDVV